MRRHDPEAPCSRTRAAARWLHLGNVFHRDARSAAPAKRSGLFRRAHSSTGIRSNRKASNAFSDRTLLAPNCGKPVEAFRTREAIDRPLGGSVVAVELHRTGRLVSRAVMAGCGLHPASMLPRCPSARCRRAKSARSASRFGTSDDVRALEQQPRRVRTTLMKDEVCSPCSARARTAGAWWFRGALFCDTSPELAATD
jgi:hypothetical protein